MVNAGNPIPTCLGSGGKFRIGYSAHTTVEIEIFKNSVWPIELEEDSRINVTQATSLDIGILIILTLVILVS